MTEPPQYKLIYFNLRILGDPIRFILNYVNVPFEDVRIQTEEEWAAIKDSTGWGKLPVLEIDGKHQLSQSHAISKYLGKKFNLDGADELESAKCDEYVGVALDMRTEWRKYWFEKEDQTKRENAKTEFINIIAPKYFNRFSKILEDNGGKYLVGSGLTWADFFVALFLELFEDTVDKDLLAPYPSLLRFKNNIYSIPQIKQAVENRPANEFWRS